ncbi:MAG: Gfo/Idh/MocA family oxidoreductase [Planctomycetota bacterium]|nr:Gfo/Idh/MocA family oxidoreductase [Planctomycetota bacterium]
MMKKVRFGIVGLGAMGSGHLQNILADGSRDLCLGAVCDIVPETALRWAEKAGVPAFTDYKVMIDSGLVDAVIIAVPHYWHAPIAICAARRKVHVLSEKPLSSTVGHARAVVAQCRRNKVALAGMLQHRTRGVMIKMKQMVDRGKVGEVFRVHLVCSNWFRTQAYYDSGAWRGTWDGEGGGVLINQAPHHLDLFQWVGLGLPQRVMGLIETREHRIEVEDTANFLCDYGRGRVGYLYATTAEQPGLEQFMISGDRGLLYWDGTKLSFGRMKMPVRKYLYGCKAMWGDPKMQDCKWEELSPARELGGHEGVVRNFAAHLLRGEKLLAPGAEAINELELSNAMYLAGHTGKTVELPVEAAAVERMIDRLERERSTGRGGGMRGKANREFRKLMRG